ncbi:MAG: hypothetical protein R2831_04010 [Chitinophagaceae bacterium]
MNKKQHHIAWLLFILIMTSQIVILSLYSALKWHQYAVKNNLYNAKKYEYIHISKTGWNTLEKIHNKEVIIQGKLFDIKRMYTQNENIVLYGHFDTQEDHLLSLTKNNQHTKDKKKSEYKFPTWIAHQSEIWQVPIKSDITKHTFFYIVKHSQLYLSESSPPPKNLFFS